MVIETPTLPEIGRPLRRAISPIQGDLRVVEEIFVRELASRSAHVRELVGRLESYRGKRLRPSLLLLCAKACGGINRKHHQLGAVVEMIHTATLVHDDVLDHADIRRHAPTINAEWGNSSSVLLGDLLFTHAFHLAAQTGSTNACRLIGETTNRVCEGELQQIGERGNLDLTEAEYIEIIEGKTAELTSCCCRLGALYSSASDEVVESMAEYGRNLGIAFQIADDILDLLGREEKVGKSLGTDLEQQKLTLPVIYLLQVADRARREKIRAILTATDNHRADKLRIYLEQSGAFKYSLDEAEKYAARARENLKILPSSECRDILESLTDLVVHRDH